MQKICVIFGGASSEHEVSLLSATNVINNLDRTKYEVILLGITKTGSWYHYNGPIEHISTGMWEKSVFLEPAILSPDPSHKGILLLGEKKIPSVLLRRKILSNKETVSGEKTRGKLRTIAVDVIFPVLHGKNGEDGTIQGLFELSGIPYAGCKVLSSAACMDKDFAHNVLVSAGINKTKLVAVYKEELADFSWLVSKLEEDLGYPMFIKPANAGSSVGITKVTGAEQISDALNLAFIHDTKVVAEKAVIGREIECAVWGGDEVHPSHALAEIISQDGFYDYDEKYKDDTAKIIAPADLTDAEVESIRTIAKKAYTTMGCVGLARVDFFIEQDGTVVLNEINTMPGFTNISMFPKLFEIDGVATSVLLDNIIKCALNR